MNESASGMAAKRPEKIEYNTKKDKDQKCAAFHIGRKRTAVLC